MFRAPPGGVTPSLTAHIEGFCNQTSGRKQADSVCFDSYTIVYSVIYDSWSVSRRAIFSPRETSPKPYGQPTLRLSLPGIFARECPDVRYLGSNRRFLQSDSCEKTGGFRLFSPRNLKATCCRLVRTPWRRFHRRGGPSRRPRWRGCTRARRCPPPCALAGASAPRSADHDRVTGQTERFLS